MGRLGSLAIVVLLTAACSSGPDVTGNGPTPTAAPAPVTEFASPEPTIEEAAPQPPPLDLASLDLSDTGIAGVRFGQPFDDAVEAVRVTLGAEQERYVALDDGDSLIMFEGTETAIWVGEPGLEVGNENGRLTLLDDGSGLFQRWWIEAPTQLPSSVPEIGTELPTSLTDSGSMHIRRSSGWFFTDWTCVVNEAWCFLHPGIGANAVTGVTAPAIDRTGIEHAGTASILGQGTVDVQSWPGIDWGTAFQLDPGEEVVLLGEPIIDRLGETWRLVMRVDQAGVNAGYLPLEVLEFNQQPQKAAGTRTQADARPAGNPPPSE